MGQGGRKGPVEMTALLGPLLSWFGGPFMSLLKGVPRVVWYILAGIAGVLVLREDARRDGLRQGREKSKEAFEKAVTDANKETETRIERAIEAGKQIDEELFEDNPGDGDLSARDLNLEQLRKLTKNDPDNLGRRVRGV